MEDRKLFKTRMCVLFKRGRCPREYCNFAHGESELRRSFNGRQENRDRDLRERLSRARSPVRKYSPERDARSRLSSHGNSPRPIRRNMMRQHMDGHGESLRMSDEPEDQRRTSSDVKMRVDEKLREIHSEIKMMDNHKQELEIYMDEKVRVAETLNSKIHDLELQISEEKEENKRITTKIKKFLKAHKRHLRLQDDLKRSHTQLQKLGEQLDLDILGPGNEDGSKIDAETAGNLTRIQTNERQPNSPLKKRPRLESHETSNRVNSNGGRSEFGKSRSEKRSGHHDQLTNSKKSEAAWNEDTQRGPLASEVKSRRGINLNLPSDDSFAEKYNASERDSTFPSTGMAAHAMDDTEVVETEEMPEVVEADTEISLKTSNLPPPPPLNPSKVYLQYEENVDNSDASAEVETA